MSDPDNKHIQTPIHSRFFPKAIPMITAVALTCPSFSSPCGGYREDHSPCLQLGLWRDKKAEWLGAFCTEHTTAPERLTPGLSERPAWSLAVASGCLDFVLYCDGQAAPSSPCSWLPTTPDQERDLRDYYFRRPPYWQRDVTVLELLGLIDLERLRVRRLEEENQVLRVLLEDERARP